MQDGLHIGCSLLGGYEGRTPKSCCLYYAAHVLISRKYEKILCLESFTFVCQLYCCSSKHNYNKALRITFNGYYVAKP